MSTRAALQMLTVALAVTAGACVSPHGAHLDPGRDPPTVTVRLEDLDLTTHVGAAAAYGRIRTAARGVCGSVDIDWPSEKAEWDRCVAQAIGHAVAALDSPGLTDYYLSRTPGAQGRPPEASVRR